MAKKKLAHAKVTVRKQVSIPRKVQDALGGLEIGNYIIFYEDGNRVVITKGDIKEI